MTVSRQFKLCIAGNTLPLPCFFPSVSSVKTNLLPVDYIELLDAAAHPLFLVSALDIANSSLEHQQRIDGALRKSKERGTAVLMDSGNYEAFWKRDLNWDVDQFRAVCRTYEHHLCFCYDNQEPLDMAETIAEDIVATVIRDQENAIGTVVPIVHAPTCLLPDVAQRTAKQLFPVILAVPERALGEGIVARIQSVQRIRRALDGLGFYCPLHLLGTGNPLSMAAYAMAGADSFDGLEWCQMVVDHETGMLFHFQHWDFLRGQTEWGENGVLPYIQSALMHNLEFYRGFVLDLRNALETDTCEEFLHTYLSEERAKIILSVIEGGS